MMSSGVASMALWPGRRVKKKINDDEPSHFGYTSQSTLRTQAYIIGPLGDFDREHFFSCT